MYPEEGVGTPHPLLYIDRFAFCSSRCARVWGKYDHVMQGRQGRADPAKEHDMNPSNPLTLVA